MLAPTAHELIAGLGLKDEAYLSIPERQQKAARMLPVRLYEHVYGMGRHLLGSALFSIKRGERAYVKNKTLLSYRGATIEYTGPELRQDDATVLLGLVHATRGKVVSSALAIDPKDFVAAIGWHVHTDSEKKLRDCIERMQSSLLRLTIDDETGLRTHLVGTFEYSASRWMVSLDERILGLFEGGTTFLPRKEREQLTDGLQTWLASFLRAQSDEVRFETVDLLRFSGSEAELRNFGAQLRETMPKLQAAGVVSGFKFGRGSLTVER